MKKVEAEGTGEKTKGGRWLINEDGRRCVGRDRDEETIGQIRHKETV